ncbi:hypothetical protein PgNI_06229 [Pyricularia grisea]|uniref:Uncharacterized protein n=1 Tax=Pyricularia grisea TaxID=148305 RepID=A0A6P8B5N0_PYRGI|nr:hypothetical protein PgNI_06229 [Pyricularia grisea]TLD10434.1 hypothetical protein PgNI_06229 [Pyricularia grisea]
MTHRCGHMDLFKINCPADSDTTTCPPHRRTAGSGGGGHQDAAVRRTASERWALQVWRPWVAEHAKTVWNWAWFNREEDLERLDRLDYCRVRMRRPTVVEPTYVLYDDDDEEDIVAGQQRWAGELGVVMPPLRYNVLPMEEQLIMIEAEAARRELARRAAVDAARRGVGRLGGRENGSGGGASVVDPVDDDQNGDDQDGDDQDGDGAAGVASEDEAEQGPLLSSPDPGGGDRAAEK